MHVAGDSAPRRSGGSRCLLGADGLEGRQQTHAPPVIGEIGPGSRGSRECFTEHLAQQAADQMARLGVHGAQLLLRVLGDEKAVPWKWQERYGLRKTSGALPMAVYRPAPGQLLRLASHIVSQFRGAVR